VRAQQVGQRQDVGSPILLAFEDAEILGRCADPVWCTAACMCGRQLLCEDPPLLSFFAAFLSAFFAFCPTFVTAFRPFLFLTAVLCPSLVGSAASCRVAGRVTARVPGTCARRLTRRRGDAGAVCPRVHGNGILWPWIRAVCWRGL